MIISCRGRVSIEGVHSRESGVRSPESGVRSPESGVWSLEEIRVQKPETFLKWLQEALWLFHRCLGSLQEVLEAFIVEFEEIL